ncbi:cation:proton antiporter, partial [Candidatus Parvarchaeota archaeon]|nr:cation:proton antiporter [Candidatus Parvarchaeota archaeon]
MNSLLDKSVSHTKTWSGYLFILLGFLMLLMVLRAAFFGHIPEEKRIWVEITLLLLVALVAERLVQQWKQPFVMVLLVLGVLVSPHTLEVVWPAMLGIITPLLQGIGIQPPTSSPELLGESEIVRTFANIGVIILLFRIGLHSEIEKVFNLKNLIVALGGVVLPFAAGFLFAQWSGGGFAYSLFVGAALTATSVGITVAVLEEMKVIDRTFAQVILGAAVIDDILALVALGLVSSMPSDLSSISIAPIAQVIGIAVVFVMSGLSLGKLFVERYFSNFEEEISKRTISGMLALLFFYSFASEALGLSAVVGAFIAGLVISYSPMAHRLNKALFTMDVVFTPMFFITLGMLVNVWEIPGAIVPVLALTLIAIITKVIGCGLPAVLMGVKPKEALLVGWGMVPRGEIALIIALIGITALDPSGKPVLDAAEYTIIASMAFLSTVIV